MKKFLFIDLFFIFSAGAVFGQNFNFSDKYNRDFYAPVECRKAFQSFSIEAQHGQSPEACYERVYPFNMYTECYADISPLAPTCYFYEDGKISLVEIRSLDGSRLEKYYKNNDVYRENFYSASGVKRDQKEYKDNKVVKERKYDEAGDLTCTITGDSLYDESGNRDGVWKEVTPYEETITTYKNGILDGAYRYSERTNGGATDIEGSYKNGKKVGKWTTEEKSYCSFDPIRWREVKLPDGTTLTSKIFCGLTTEVFDQNGKLISTKEEDC